MKRELFIEIAVFVAYVAFLVWAGHTIATTAILLGEALS